MNVFPKIAIQCLAYRHPGSPKEACADLDRCFASLQTLDYPKERFCFVVLDNASTHGSFEEQIKEKWLPESEKSLPKVFLLSSQVNTGFAGGHMLALETSKAWEADYVYLLNQDAFCDPHMLSEVVKVAEQLPQAASVQSRIMLAQDPQQVNSCGNCLHYLGFGYYDNGVLGARPHFYNSGAGLLIRMDCLEKIGGLFDPAYFMYHEDVDFAWRARLAGYTHAYAEDSVIYHRYEFSRSIKKFYDMEKNRFFTHFANLKWQTLCLLFPAMIFMEVGTFLFALKGGWGWKKICVWGYFCKPSTWKRLWQKRRFIKQMRQVSDREMLDKMVGTIEAQEVKSFLMKWMVNPFLNAYFIFLKKIVRW